MKTSEQNAESKIEEMEAYLDKNGWHYRGCGEWQDPVTSLKYASANTAYDIQKQRECSKSQLNHTPAPWVVRGEQVMAHRPHTFGGYNEEPVLALSRSPEERRANAVLMAASPEILVALQELLYVVSPLESASLTTPFQKARAAIAKATVNQ